MRHFYLFGAIGAVGDAQWEPCTTSALRLFRVPMFQVAALNLVRCLHDLPWRSDPASRTWESAKPETLPTCLCDMLALPNVILVVIAIMFETTLFYGPPVLAVVQTPTFTVPEQPPFPYWVLCLAAVLKRGSSAKPHANEPLSQKYL